MSIWSRLYGAISGGWKTYGPNSINGPGAFDEPAGSPYESVTQDMALKLSAVWACMHLRSETLGSLPLHLRDASKKIIKDHDLYAVIHESPNSMQTAAEYWSLQTAHVDMHGNAISIITRRSNKSVISLEPVEPCLESIPHQKKSGVWFYKIGGEDYPAENVLHMRGFSMNNNWGYSRLSVGRQMLSSQLSANDSAHRAFKQSLKVGGFIVPELSLDPKQIEDFKKRLDNYGLPENAGKFMTLLKGMKPISGSEFRLKPADAELLASRGFGIEEICRLFNTPPQLIGHTDKASSWASSIEQINLFFLMYSLQPTFIRMEQRIRKSLLTTDDRAKDYQAKFSIQGLLRADNKTQQAMFASALQNGYYSRNEVRDLLDRADIPGGDAYTIQLNMGKLGAPDATQGN
jgi:HK97 family phage portal protein